MQKYPISFSDFNIIENSVTCYVGGKNYLSMFQDSKSLIAFRNTLLYTLVTVPGQMALGLILPPDQYGDQGKDFLQSGNISSSDHFLGGGKSDFQVSFYVG